MKEKNSTKENTQTAAQKEDKRQNETIRIKKAPSNFVTLHKGFIEDRRLSFKAKGILTYLLSKPDNWKVIVKDIENYCTDGRDSIYSGLKELKEFGYYRKEPIRDEKGCVIYWESIIYEYPEETPNETPSAEKENKNNEKTPISPLLTDFPYLDKPYLDKPYTENTDRNNININNNKNSNKNDVSIYQTEDKTEAPVKQPTEDNKDTQNKTTAMPPIDMIDTTNNKNNENSITKVYSQQEVSDKISLNELKETHNDKLEEIDMLYEIVCEILTEPNPFSRTYRISKSNIPLATVKRVFDGLEKRHIEYVLHSLVNNDNKNKINKNIKSYLMTSLFHAPSTISYYWDKKFKTQNTNKKSSFDADLWLEKLAEKSRKY